LYAVKEGKNYNTYGIGGSLNSKKLASNIDTKMIHLRASMIIESRNCIVSNFKRENSRAGLYYKF
jgi:hypothetical protein